MKKTSVLAVFGLALSMNLFAANAEAYYINNGYAMPVSRTTQSDNIASIQSTLSHLGYFVGSQGITGSMNSATRNAVKQFQADNGLKVDGVVGVSTAQALNKMINYVNYSHNRSGFAPVAYQPVYYNNGYAPARVQHRANGIYW